MSKQAQQLDTDQFLTVSEVARILRVDDTTVRRWVKSGAIDAVTLPHIGNRQAYRIRKSVLDEVMARTSKEAA